MHERNPELTLAEEVALTEERLHLLEGIASALEDLAAVIEAVTRAEDADAAREALRARFGFSALQATAVLDQQYRRATRRDRERAAEACQELRDHLDSLKRTPVE